MEIERIGWILLTLITFSIGLVMLGRYRQNRDLRMMMFAIGFLSSTVSWLDISLSPGLNPDDLFFWNLYYWSSVPLMLAIFITVAERLISINNFRIPFAVFSIGTVACYALILIPGDYQPLFKGVTLYIGVFIICSSAYLFTRDRNSLDLLYLFAIIAYMIGGMAQGAGLTGLPFFAFLYGDFLLGLLFLGDLKGRSGPYFSIKKKLEETENLLASTEERYRRIVENASDIIILTRGDGVICYVSPSLKSILDTEPASIIGRNILDTYQKAPEPLRHFYSNLEGKTDRIEFEYVFPTSLSEPKIFLHIVKKLDSSGTIEVIHVLKDITDIRKTQDVLDKKIKDLEKSERASLNIMEDLNETVDTLRSIEKKLASKNKELEDYTYTVSHDLKAPLVTIQGFSDMLAANYNDKLDEKGRHYIDRINQASEKLNTLISDLLELSRAGRKLKPFQWHDFNSIVSNSLDSLEGKFAARRVNIVRPNDFPKIYGDDMRLSQVMNNLLANAVNYMGDQENPEIRLGWRENGIHYEFWVQDNGIGIKQEDQARIFMIFERASGSETEGSGIGLSIVKKIVETHGGEIHVESEYGNGSTFTFTIPKMGVQI